MDYLEYDSYNDAPGSIKVSEPAHPAAPLILPLNTVTNKFKSLSILSTLNLNKQATKESRADEEEDLIDIAQQTAKKYSQMTLDLFEANELGLDSASTGTGGYSTNSNNNNPTNTNTADLSLKLSKILNSYGYDTDATLRESLEFLQTTDNNIGSDKTNNSSLLSDQFTFRNTVETELLKSHAADLKLFSGVVGDLEEVRMILDHLNSFDFLKSQDNDAQSKDTKDNQLHNQIEQLQRKKNLLQLKRSLLINFKSQFLVSEYDESLAYKPTSQLSLETFTTFNKIYKTYQNAEVLMGITGSQIGVKIMERLSTTLSSYYQCFQSYLSHSIQTNSSTSTNSTTLNLKLIKLCNLFLTANINQFQDPFIVDFQNTRISELRHDLKSQLNQLNISVVDTNRYIGDVMAYMHSVFVNEMEYVRGLFEINLKDFEQEEANAERSVIEEFLQITGTSVFKQQTKDSHDELIVVILDSLTGLLESRLSMVLNSERNQKVLVNCYQSLDFYGMIFGKMKIEKLGIFKLLKSLQDIVSKKILYLIESQYKTTIKELEDSAWKLDDDLLLSQDWLSSYLSETLIVLESSSSDSAIFSNENFLESFKDLLIFKPIELIYKQAKLNFPKTKPINVDKVRDMNIFTLNNLDYLKYKTLPYPQLSSSSIDLFGITELLTKITSNELDATLESLSLKIPNQLITLVYPPSQIEYEEDYEMYRSLLEHKIFSLDNLYEIDETLKSKLPELNLILNNNLNKIQGPVYVNEILDKVNEGVLDVYKVFFKIVWMLYEEEDENDDQKSVIIHEGGRKVLKWSVEEVKTLIGL